ncbi:HNH endonuclease [Loktanella sp. M215]|uniref:HNH endonuclease n=1 Tax=Loktanella sp. M215 TaxID=2675431 RepID=UPI001F1A3AFD|nr:HNH endonuclease [Loktanella sp. M215]MCF7699953.1 hypothetical protein [Loktanella sp. M215]
MNTFILKINGDTRCPGGINVPTSIDDWKSGEFFAKRIASSPSKYVDGTVGPEPVARDQIYLWVNEHSEKSRGVGLTAVALIKSISAEADSYRIATSDLVLLEKAISMDRAHATLPSSPLVVEMKRYRHERIWALSENDVGTVEGLIDGAGGLGERTGKDSLLEALRDEAQNIETALQERKAALIKPRPGQAAFRQAAIERHDGRCVFTRTNIPDVLEAAHVIPHTGAVEFERADNSLLLRRDIHALFDLFLLSIDAESGQVLVSPKLDRSLYAKLRGRVVRHRLAHAALDFHANQFAKLSQL